MAVVSISRVRKRVIELLLAAGRGARYTDAVGDQKRYAALQELTDAIIEADMQVCLAILETPGHPYASGFMTASSNLANGDILPAFVGALGKVEIDPTGAGTFRGGILAPSLDELLEVIHHASLFPTCTRYYWVEGNVINHSGSAARVYYPSFTKNDSACQAHEAYTLAVLCRALSVLRKDGGDPGFYSDYAQMADIAELKIRGKETTLPDLSRLRLELQKRGRDA